MDTVEAKALLELSKTWIGSPHTMSWIQVSSDKTPASHKLQAALSDGSIALEGVRVDCWFKPSCIAGLTDSVSFSIIADKQRIFGFDIRPNGEHINTVGQGHEFYKKTVAHPHKHLPIDDVDLSGYAVPINNDTNENHWQSFIDEANINGAPVFKVPTIQTELDL